MKKYVILLIFNILASYIFGQTDVIPPHITCKSIQNFQFPFCPVSLFATDFVDAANSDLEDGTVELNIRKRCVGSDYPEGQWYVTYADQYEYLNFVEVWARDTAGNTATCIASVSIQESLAHCDPTPLMVWVNMPNERGVDHVQIEMVQDNCLNDSIVNTAETKPYYQSQDSTICCNASYFGQMTIGYNVSITPSKKINPTNGVTTYDLVLIQKHILGITPLDSPYKLIAADANMDGAVTGADVILLRKLLLGIIQELPHGQSWRFVPLEYEFPNQANPFVPPFPEQYVSPVTEDPKHSFVHFIGVKIGDVNYTAFPEN